MKMKKKKSSAEEKISTLRAIQATLKECRMEAKEHGWDILEERLGAASSAADTIIRETIYEEYLEGRVSFGVKSG
jgi:hypothetical protein